MTFQHMIAATLAAGSMLNAALADALEGKTSPGEILASATAEDWRTLDPENTLYIELERGRVIVWLSPHLAPTHVAQVKALAREGFYDGLSFYRVIDGFVAQGGDPFSEREIKTAAQTMTAEFDDPFRDDLAIAYQNDADGYADKVGWLANLPVGVDAGDDRVWHLHCPGAFAFGRENERDTASTEFYIALQAQRYLDRNLSVFGRVVDGMAHLQALRRVSPPEEKTDDVGETILAFKIAADLPPEERTPLEVLSSDRPVFADFVEARRNRPEAFFHFRHDYADICQLPQPVRRIEREE